MREKEKMVGGKKGIVGKEREMGGRERRECV